MRKEVIWVKLKHSTCCCTEQVKPQKLGGTFSLDGNLKEKHLSELIALLVQNLYLLHY